MALTKISNSMNQGCEATPLATLLGPPSADGPDPIDAGIEWLANNTLGTQKKFAAIQCEIQIDTPGNESGRMHFLVSQDDFLQVIGTITRQGSWVVGPGAPSYIMQIAGEQTINGVVSTTPIFGERLSVEDPDYVDMRGFAIRNVKITDLTDLDYSAGIGFSVLNTDGKERETALLRTKYSVRTAGSEYSYMYPATLVNGVQISGPYFHNSGVSFNGTLNANNILSAYKNDTLTLPVTGIVGSPNINVYYTQVGNLVTLTFPTFSGTSNSALFQIDFLPTNIRPSDNRLVMMRVIDNSVQLLSPGIAYIKASGRIDIYKDLAEAAFTASGTKGINPLCVSYTLY